MSNRTRTCWVLAFAAMFVFFAGCPRGPKRVYAPPYNTSAGKDAVKAFDANGDGKLSGEELNKCPGLKAALTRLDPVNKSDVTADAITARVQSWIESKLGRMSFVCRVTHNGRPIQGAEVKFVPEPFLGEKVQTAVGKTDQNGMAMICIPELTPPGIAPGFYRVEITKAGVNIPAKYNSETVFGQEIARDVYEIQEGITFDMKF